MRFAAICLLILSGCCAEIKTTPPAIATPQIETQEMRSKVVRTITALSDFDLKDSMEVIDAVEKNDSKRQSDLGAAFVKSAYERGNHGLDTTDCKIIWKAILVSCKTDQDGFELMNVPTPWLGK
jgi:hypothetical protein